MNSSLFAQLSNLVGPEKTELLCHHFGGISYYIPVVPTQKHKFLAYISLEDFKKICSEFGGNRLILPKARSAFKKHVIQELLRQGRFSVRRIADITGSTERYVSRISGEISAAGPEDDLPLFHNLGG